jgi:uncharacterized membrane protein
MIIMGTTITDTTAQAPEFSGRNRPLRTGVATPGENKTEMRLARGLGWFSIGLGMAELLAPSAVGRLVGARNHRGLIRFYGVRELAAGVGILAARRPGPWLWSRVAGDVVDLASLGKTLTSAHRGHGRAAFGIASVAAVTALDVICAQRLTEESGWAQARAEASAVVNRPPEECYSFWRNFENLPQFMTYLESVRVRGDNRSHWIADVAGLKVEWDAEIENDIPNQQIAWRSLANSDVSHSGSVEFARAPGGRGTIVRVRMDYGDVPQAMGAAAAAIVGKNPEQMIWKELRRFKQVMETGEVITTDGQPAGRRRSVTWIDRIAR